MSLIYFKKGWQKLKWSQLKRRICSFNAESPVILYLILNTGRKSKKEIIKEKL